MRDPNRIPEVLAEVERVWKLYPDMRLGQLIANAVALAAPDRARSDGELARNIMLYDEDRILAGLKKFAARIETTASRQEE